VSADEQTIRDAWERAIVAHLDLQPWETHAADAFVRFGGRRSGKTTRTLVHALVSVGRGKRVTLVGDNVDDLRYRFLAMADRCRIKVDEAMLEVIPYARAERAELRHKNEPMGSREVFYDHYRRPQ
jgi:hypothetical protein